LILNDQLCCGGCFKTRKGRLIDMQDKEEKQQLIESYILGAAMNGTYALRVMLDSLEPNEFFFHEHRHIFMAMRTLYDSYKGDKLEGVCEAIGKYLKVSGIDIPMPEIFAIYDNGSSADVNYYLDRLKSNGFRSKAYEMLVSTAKQLDVVDEPHLLIQDMKTNLDKIDVKSGKDFVSLKEICENYNKGKSFMEVFDEDMELVASGVDVFDGFRTGYRKLDELIGGFQNGTTNIIGARSSSGKTTFLINLIMNLTARYPDKIKVGFFSLEMSKTMIWDKLISTVANVPYDIVKGRKPSQEQYQEIYRVCRDIQEWPIYLHNHARVTASSMERSIKRAIMDQGLNFIMTDYLTLVRADKNLQNKHMEIDQISKMLQTLAKELNIPFVTLAQLNRSAAARTDKRPVTTDLRESGSIEEDADTILLMHRPAQYADNLPDHTEIIVAKNRMQGYLGKCIYRYDKGRLIEFPDIEKMRPDEVIAVKKEETKEWQPRGY